MKRLFIIFALVFLSLDMNAQPSFGSPAPQGGQQKGGRPGWEQIESMKVAFFTSEMDLSPEEAAKFWPIYNQYSKEQRELGMKTHSLFLQMEEAIRKGGSSDVELKKLVSSYEDARVKETELVRLYTDEFYKVLTPEKTVRLFMVEEHFRFRMINTWRTIRPEPGSDKGDPFGKGQSGK